MTGPLSLLISILVLLSAAGIGLAYRSLWREEDELHPEPCRTHPEPCRTHPEPCRRMLLDRLVIDTSFGLGIVSLYLFLLGAAQFYQYKWVVFLVGLVGLICLPKLIREVRQGWPREKTGRGRWIAVLPLLVLAVAALIPAMAPPAMDDWDSLAYHLAVPKLYLEHGGIYYISFTTHSNFPFLTEMLYLPGLALNDPVAAKLMHFWMGVLLVLAVYVLARRHLAPYSGPLAALAVAGMPIVLWEATTAYVDLSTALYTVLAAYMLLNYLDKPDKASLIGCGMAAGFAASTKMTGLAVLPLLALWLVVARYADVRKLEFRQVAGLLGVGLLVCAPWYVKSIIYTANPVYPFFYSIFGGRDWSADLAATYSMLQSKFGMGHEIGGFLALPYDLTMNSDRFYDTPGLFVGPIFLVGIPVLLLMLQSRTRKLVGLLGFFLAQVVIWFLLTQQSRYLIPAFGILAALIAGIAYSDRKLTMLQPALWITFGLTAVFAVVTMAPRVQSRFAVAIGQESRGDYLSGWLDTYQAQSWANENLPRGSKIALYGDTRGFYLDRPYVWADASHNLEFTRDFGSTDELIGYLLSRGVTHVVINYNFSFPQPAKARGAAARLYDAMVRRKLVPVYPDLDTLRGVTIYEVRR